MNRNPELLLVALLVSVVAVPGCGGGSVDVGSVADAISAQDMADALYAVIESDRTVYATEVVHRLQDEEAVIAASEHWRNDKALPLPAQMFRMGAERTAEKTDRLSYALLSPWPIQKSNAPRTEMEAAGLDQVVSDPSRPFYGTETLGGVEYFTAVYPDIAVSPACIACHNAHRDSPRDDFELGDTMGGVVVRIRLS